MVKIFEHLPYLFFLELGGAIQLMGIMKLLIDPENMMATALVSSLSV